MNARTIWLVLCLAVCSLGAQTMKLTVGQLKSFIKSSVQLKHPDKQVADYLKKVELTERLMPGVYEELVALGAGGRTIEALRALMANTRGLAKPPAEPAAPPAAVIPPPTAADQKRIIEEARQYALNYSKQLPDFLCTQVTLRYLDPSGLDFFTQQDRLVARLSYFEQKEEYKMISVNGSLIEIPYERMGGATSSGEFGTMMKEIFDPASDTQFTWERWGRLRDRTLHVYRYRVPQSRSKWTVSYERRQNVTPGYRGFVYIDKQAPIILRITLEAENLPPSFPIQQATNMLDYDFATIAGKEFLLPMRAEVRMREGKLLAKNVVEFRNYRKFGADTSISFDVTEPIPEEKLKEKPPR